MSERQLSALPEPVATELKRLTRRLFVEKYGETADYRRNMEILKFLQTRLGEALGGPGPAQEILQLAFSEVGGAAKFMKEDQWLAVFENVITRIREAGGDVAGDKAMREWGPELRRLLKSFV